VQHLVHGHVLRDADHRLHARVDGLEDRVGCEPRGDEDERRVRALLPDCVGDGVEDRNAFDVLTGLARRDAGDDVRAVRPVAKTVEAALAPGQPLDDEARVVVDDDRYLLIPLMTSVGRSIQPPLMRSPSSSRTRG
jgi:hypothetical protein